jgi:hypothetical protein
MEDITKKPCLKTVSGYLKIGFAPVNEIKSVDLFDINTKKVTFNTGGRFAEIEAQNIQFKNQPSDGAYESAVTCDFYGSYPELTPILDMMTKNRFLVRLYDRNYVWWLQGDITEPMRFEYSQITDSETSGFMGYRLKFSCRTTMPLCKLQIS